MNAMVPTRFVLVGFGFQSGNRRSTRRCCRQRYRGCQSGRRLSHVQLVLGERTDEVRNLLASRSGALDPSLSKLHHLLPEHRHVHRIMADQQQWNVIDIEQCLQLLAQVIAQGMIQRGEGFIQ